MRQQASLTVWPASPLVLFDPSSIAGLKLWLKADSLALSDGDPISTWPDSSGNGFDATAAGTLRPTYKTAIQNGLPVARYAGGQVMDITAVVSGQPCTIFFVAKDTLGGSHFIDGSGGGRITAGINGLGFPNMFAGSFVDGATESRSAFHVFTYIFNGASSSIYRDGILDASGNAGTAGGSVILFGGDGGGSNLTGDIAESLGYDTALTGNRGSVEVYLKNKWATP